MKKSLAPRQREMVPLISAAWMVLIAQCIWWATVLRIQGGKEGIIGLGIAFVLVGEDNQWYIVTMTGCCERSTVALQTRGSEWSDVHDLGAVV